MELRSRRVHPHGRRLRIGGRSVPLATKQITPTFLLGLDYIYTTGRYPAGTRQRLHQVDIGSVYSLSKRTDLFLYVVYQRVAGDARFAQMNFCTRRILES